MTKGDPAEEPIQRDRSRPFAKESRPVFLTALAALVLSGTALGFASFAVWQNSHKATVAPPLTSDVALLETTEKRFILLKAKIVASEKNQLQAIATLSQRLDKQATATPADSLELVGAEIDRRFATLEMVVKDLAAAILDNPPYEADGVVNNGFGSDFSITPDQVSLLIVSGILADNMTGASLDRWISLLQGLENQGVAIPDLAQLRTAATPTPETRLHLIRRAHDLVPQMTAALNKTTDEAGFLEKTRAKLSQLVQLREVGVGANSREAALSAFETSLAIQDLDGAVRAAGHWSGQDLQSLKNWMAAAQSRQALDRAVSMLVADRLASAIAVQL